MAGNQHEDALMKKFQLGQSFSIGLCIRENDQDLGW